MSFLQLTTQPFNSPTTDHGFRGLAFRNGLLSTGGASHNPAPPRLDGSGKARQSKGEKTNETESVCVGVCHFNRAG